MESESGLREASVLIVDESEHEGSEENVGYLERVTRFCTSCFCCCQCLWKKSFSLPIPESCEDDQVNRDDISRCSLVEESVENELVDSARGSRKERERNAEGGEEGYCPSSAVEETVSSDSELETPQNPGEACPLSADASEGVSLLQPETTQSRSELALSKHKGSATDKQQSKKVRSRKRSLVEDRQRQVSEQDIDEPPKCKSFDRNSTSNTSIAEESSNVPSGSNKSSAIHNTNKCSTVVEQNEAVKQAHVVDGNEYKNVEKASRHVESEPQIARKTEFEDVKEVRVQIQKHCSSDDGYCSRQTSRQDSQQLGHMESEPQIARKAEFEDIKEVRVQKIQKQSSDGGYCSRQTSRQDSQQLGAEDSLDRVSSTDQTCLVNRQKSADSALGYVPESGSDF